MKFEDILTKHIEITRNITSKYHPLPDFRRYLRYGYLPIIIEGEDNYLVKLGQVINTIVDVDLAYISSYNSGTAVKVKKLLGVIAESAPFKPNIAAIAKKLDLSRDSVYQYIHQLRNARLLNTLTAEGKGASILQKPEKLFLENTNLAYALKEHPDAGNLRETFAFNQLLNAGYTPTAPRQGDFALDELIIEIGGRSKNKRQVEFESNYLIVADDIEVGTKNKIPLWLLGFLY